MLRPIWRTAEGRTCSAIGVGAGELLVVASAMVDPLESLGSTLYKCIGPTDRQGFTVNRLKVAAQDVESFRPCKHPVCHFRREGGCAPRVCQAWLASVRATLQSGTLPRSFPEGRRSDLLLTLLRNMVVGPWLTPQEYRLPSLGKYIIIPVSLGILTAF